MWYSGDAVVPRADPLTTTLLPHHLSFVSQWLEKKILSRTGTDRVDIRQFPATKQKVTVSFLVPTEGSLVERKYWGGEACALTSPSSFLLLQLKGRREQSPATGSTFDGTMMVGGRAAHPNPTLIPVATIERSLCAFICHRNDFWWDECGWGKNCAPHPNLMLAFMWVPSSILELASLLGSAVS